MEWGIFFPAKLFKGHIHITPRSLWKSLTLAESLSSWEAEDLEYQYCLQEHPRMAGSRWFVSTTPFLPLIEVCCDYRDREKTTCSIFACKSQG